MRQKANCSRTGATPILLKRKNPTPHITVRKLEYIPRRRSLATRPQPRAVVGQIARVGLGSKWQRFVAITIMSGEPD